MLHLPDVALAFNPAFIPLIVEGARQVGNWWSQRRQEKMANKLNTTQYQRSVEDMMQAGLNPALMYSKGAGGGEPNVMPEKFRPLEEVLSSAGAMAAIAKTTAEARVASSAARLNELEFEKLGSDWYYQKDFTKDTVINRYDKLVAELSKAKSDAKSAESGAEKAKIDVRISRLEEQLTRTESQIASQNLKVAEYSARGAQARDKVLFSDVPWSEKIKHLLPVLLQEIGSAGSLYNNVRPRGRVR